MEKLIFTDEECTRLDQSDITALVLFGSRAQGIAREDSDYDIGVLTPPEIMLNPAKRKDLYEMLYDTISAHINTLSDIDIVFLIEAPSELQAHVMKYGKVLFEAHPTAFAVIINLNFLTVMNFPCCTVGHPVYSNF